jgi:hypothetical protein
MKLITMKSIFKSVVIALILSLASVAIAQSPSTAMTNNAVIKLVRAGFKDKTVIAIIHSRPNHFELEPDRLIELKRNGVSENIILAMLSQGDAIFTDEDFSFSDSDHRSKKLSGDSGGDDIFGDRAGTRNETRGRGTSGSNEGARSTTGNATVRILRPPADEKGAGLKLEKTPTLTNDSIIGLVDAGFSEGTIIKRIEDSPVDFDLSDPRVADLRRHRVTEPVILAMKTAIRGDSDLTQPKTRSN